MVIQKLRLQRGWSQQQLADLSGLSVRTIQRMEQGQAASNESLKSLAAVFEVDFLTLKDASMTDKLAHSIDNDFPAIAPSGVTHDEALALKHVRKLKGFYLHLAQYVLVIGALAMYNMLSHPQNLWVVWPALGWGLGVMLHAVRVFDWSPWGSKWEKEQVEKHLGRKL